MIAGEVKSVRHALLLPFQDNQRVVHIGNLKLHVYPQVNHELLFNLAYAPHELTNLTVDPAYRDDLDHMHLRMDEWQTQLGAPDPLISQNPQPKTPR